jgi:hypothetical protein
MTPKPTSIPRLALIALAVLLQAAAPVAVEPSAKFDETRRAPQAPTNKALKVSIREYFEVYERATSESLAGLVRDKVAFDKWVEAEWRLQRAIDTRRDLGDLTRFGITPNGDGTYSIDIGHFPQWTPVSDSARRILEPGVLEAYVPQLKARGFRDQDIETVKAYIHEYQPDRMAQLAKLSLVDSFAKSVQRGTASNEKLGTDKMLDYLYQNRRIMEEAKRAWTLGLLDSLDAQRQRILESFLSEVDRAGAMAVAPDDIEGATRWMGDAIASGEHQRLLEAERAKLRDTEIEK